MEQALCDFLKNVIVKGMIILLDDLNLKYPGKKFLDENTRIIKQKKREYGDFSCNILIKLERLISSSTKDEEGICSGGTKVDLPSNKVMSAIEKAIENKKFSEKDNCFIYFFKKKINDDIDFTIEFKIDIRSRGFINFFLINGKADRELIIDRFIKNDKGVEFFPVRSIGHCYSCWIEKFGIPRQGTLVPSSRGVIKLFSEYNKDFISGLNEFSHLWVIFIFNDLSEANKVKPVVHPPRLNGKSTGVFSTRTPHRVNKIGISNVKIESINDNSIYVSGLDILDGTPVIDIKPYHICDIVDKRDLNYPDWVVSNSYSGFKVDIPDKLVDGLLQIVNMERDNIPKQGKLNELERKLNKLHYGGKWPFMFFETHTEFLETIKQCLSYDVRCKQRKVAEYGGLYQLRLDTFEIHYKVNDVLRVVEVINLDLFI